MRGKNPQRERFLMAFSYVFPTPSETMGVKCWRDIASLLPGVRFALIEALCAVAKAKAEQEYRADEQSGDKR